MRPHARRMAAAVTAAVVALVIAACSTTSSTPKPATPKSTTTGTPSGSAGPTSSPPRAFVRKRLTVLITGDIVIHTGVWQTAEHDAAAAGEHRPDFRPMFASIRPDVEAADLAICRFQLPVSPPGGPYFNYPVFQSPPEVISGLKATGYDACTTAGNHNLDEGWAGIQRTVATYNRVGLPQTGMSVSRRQNRAPLMLEVKGVKIALLSYAYGTNGIPVPADEPWAVRLINPKRMVRDAAKARRRGADIVIVDVHAGTEYVNTPNQEQVDVVNQISKSPNIDLMYGAHPHVTQPFAVVHHKWVAYSLGNLVAQQHPPNTYYSAMARFTFVNHRDGSWHVRKAEYVPTLTTPNAPAMRVLNAVRALHNPRLAAWAPQLRAAIADTRRVVTSENATAHGLVMGR
jgi:poly-gamma-glutamate capsule biosynthesis protein CapA/YwtB (metallophosphatase superfamily)